MIVKDDIQKQKYEKPYERQKYENRPINRHSSQSKQKSTNYHVNYSRSSTYEGSTRRSNQIIIATFTYYAEFVHAKRTSYWYVPTTNSIPNLTRNNIIIFTLQGSDHYQGVGRIVGRVEKKDGYWITPFKWIYLSDVESSVIAQVVKGSSTYFDDEKILDWVIDTFRSSKQREKIY